MASKSALSTGKHPATGDNRGTDVGNVKSPKVLSPRAGNYLDSAGPGGEPRLFSMLRCKIRHTAGFAAGPTEDDHESSVGKSPLSMMVLRALLPSARTELPTRLARLSAVLPFRTSFEPCLIAF
jgi:hypothetical protein